MQTIINICLKNKSKQSYVWIDSIFEAQSICFGNEIAGLLDFSYNKYALEPKKFKNNLTMFESKLILKLPPFFTHCVGEGRRR